MNFAVLALMIAVLGYNAYGVMQVGVANASTMQWVTTVAMLVFVILRIMRLLSSDKSRE